MKVFKRAPARCVAFVLCTAVASTEAFCQSDLPWELQDHYSFATSKATLGFAVRSGEWQIEIPGAGLFIEGAYAEVVLEEDGHTTTLRPSEKTFVRETRTKTGGPLGAGTRFESEFMLRADVVARYGVVSFKNQPFLLLDLEIENIGDKALEVAALSSGVFTIGPQAGPAVMETVSLYRARDSDAFQVGREKEFGALLIAKFPRRDSIMGLGVLNTPRAVSTITAAAVRDRWHGRAESRFTPRFTLLPKQRIRAAPLWVSLANPDMNALHDSFWWSRRASSNLDARTKNENRAPSAGLRDPSKR